MLKKILITGILAAASTMPAFGHSGYDYDDYVDARVIRVDPVLSFSYSNWGDQDRFRIQYAWGDNYYWTYAPRHPGHWIRVRPPRVIHHHYYPPGYYRWQPPPHKPHPHWRHDSRRSWDDDHRRRDRDDDGRRW